MEATRVGVVEIQRDQERVRFTCRICDVRTDLPSDSELVDWTGRGFLFVHEHSEHSSSVTDASADEVLGVHHRATLPRQGWPSQELNPLVPVWARRES